MKTLKSPVLLMLSLASLQSEAFLPKVSVKSPGLPKENVIYRGTPVAEGGETWKSTVQIEFPNSMCTASFHEQNVLITAAHCVKDDVDTSSITVNFFRGSEIYDTKSFSAGEYVIKYNPKYRGQYSNDFAVIVFKTVLYDWGSDHKNLTFIHTDIASAVDWGSKVYISGSGLTNARENVGNYNLYFATGKIIGFPFGDSMEVAMNPPYAVCGGDSGSPVTVKIGGEFYLAGVLSASTRNIGKYCGTTADIAFLTAEDANWIYSAIEEANNSL